MTARRPRDPPEPVWPLLVPILLGLTLLYLAPQVTLVATFTLIGGLAGVVVFQRRQHRRYAADPTVAT